MADVNAFTAGDSTEESTGSAVTRRRFIQLGTLLGGAWGVGAPASVLAQSAGQAKVQKGGTLVMLVVPEPPTLAGYQSTSGPVGQVSTKVYEGLLEYGFDLQPRPSLARSWEVSNDGLTITFKLQDGVKFHDGKPFTSEDVRFSVMDVLKKIHPRGAATTFRHVVAVETPDPLTAVFKLDTAAPYLMMGLSSYESPMLPKHLFEGENIQRSEYANKPVGTGPFIFKEWRRGEFVLLEKNKNYWKPGEPNLDRIAFRFIPDAGSRSAAIEAGEAHLGGFSAIPNVDIARLKEKPFIEATTRGYEMQAPITMLDFNTKRKPFDNVKVRQAISYAIDRQFVIDHIWFGFGKKATGPISSNFSANGIYTPDVHNYDVPNRVEIANKLLDEAGLPKKADGTRFEIVHDITPYGDEWRRFGEYIQQVLGSIGIKATLRYEDVPTWLRRVYTNYDFDLTSNWVQTLADPVIGAHRFYSSKTITPGAVFVNDSQWSTPETDELLDRAAVETDPKKRNEIYHRFQKLVVEAAPYVWVHEIEFVTVKNKRVKDDIVTPLGLYGSFGKTWLDKA